jgi:outer membrane protein TolC
VKLERLLLVVAIAAVSVLPAGCAPESYQRSADAEVYRLLAKRKKGVLDYQPETAVAATPGLAAPRRAYEKIPVTPVPPLAPPPVKQPEPVEVPYGPLGPEARWIGQPVPDGLVEQPEALGVEIEGAAAQAFVAGPPSPRQPTARFDLFRSMEYAVQHSRDYRERVEDLYLDALEVTLERHLLSPRPFASAGTRYTGGQERADYQSALAVTANAGVRQRLPYGGEVVAETIVEFVNALSDSSEANSGESAQVVLSGSVPLLRGAGLVNLEGLISAERGLVYGVRAFEDYRRQFAVDVSRAYFNLLTRQQSVRNSQVNYENLAVLTERTIALFAAGRISFLEVQRSRQALLQAEQRVVAAREVYQNSVDSFKLQIGMPVSEELAIIPVALDLTTPDLDVDAAMRTALHFRLDLQTARDRIDDTRRGIANARNGLLPGLDLNADARVGSGPDRPAKELEDSTWAYSAGMTLDLPIDQLPERNVYRRSLISHERARRDFEDLRDRVLIDVREDVRSIRTAQVSLRIQEESIELAQRRLDLASELLRQGGAGGGGATRRGDARDVVEAQQALIQAQDAYEVARAQLQIQVLQFLRDTGTLRVDPSAGLIGRAMAPQARPITDRTREEPAGLPRVQNEERASSTGRSL